MSSIKRSQNPLFKQRFKKDEVGCKKTISLIGESQLLNIYCYGEENTIDRFSIFLMRAILGGWGGWFKKRLDTAEISQSI